MARTVLAAVVAAVWVGAWPGAAEAASWSWPVAGVVSRPFAPPEHRWGVGHRGVDLLTAPGAPVRAAGAGRVSYAGLLAGRGVVVVVHGALRTTYEPVTATVGLGDLVAGGEVIGEVEAGHLGCPVLACLHWGLRRGEDYLDPVRLVEPGPVRLLPVAGAAPQRRAALPDLPDGAASGVRAGRGAGGGGPPAAASARLSASAAVRPSASAPARLSASAAARPSGSAGDVPAGRRDGEVALAALGAGAVLAGVALRRGAR